MDLEFPGEVWFWRGPAPWYFVTVPPAASQEIASVAAEVTYGWGVIPVSVLIGRTSWQTSLFPKDGQYVVPVKAQVRRDEDIDLGDVVTVKLSLHVPGERQRRRA